MKKRIKTLKKELRWKNFVFLTIAGIINAFGVTMFLQPVKLYDSGVSGTAMLLAQVTPEWMSLSVFLLVLNIPLFLFGYKKQGLGFTINAVYAVLIYSLTAFLITDVLPVDVSMASPLAESDLLLCAIFGGLISGMGSGLTIRFGGAMDGMEVVAVTFAKKLGLSVDTLMMFYNVILYIVCGIIINSWILPLYSIVAYAVALKTVDYIVEGIDHSKAATIITNNADEVSAVLSGTFECGVTMLPAKGYYSGLDKTMLYVIVNRFQIPKLRDLVHEYDPTAYISITDVADVFKANSKK